MILVVVPFHINFMVCPNKLRGILGNSLNVRLENFISCLSPGSLASFPSPVRGLGTGLLVATVTLDSVIPKSEEGSHDMTASKNFMYYIKGN